MPRPENTRFAKSTASLLAVSLAGLSLAHVATGSDPNPSLLAAAVGFAANVTGEFGKDALKGFIGACFQRRTPRIEDNDVVVRGLRRAQLEALRQIRNSFEQSYKGDFNKIRVAKNSTFLDCLDDYLNLEEARISTLKLADLAEFTDEEAGTEALKTRLIQQTSDQFSASLSTRHGAGPTLDVFRHTAQASMLAELSHNVVTEIPPSFESLVIGSKDGANGWFALFVRSAAQALRAGGEFERAWAAQQSSVIRHLVEMANEKIDDLTELVAATDASVLALKNHGGKLDAIAGGVNETIAILTDMKQCLQSDASWISIEIDVSIDGWYRFAARNPSIPFIGRERELAELHQFLHSPSPFSWWVVSGPGGSGKTRLALELCYRANTKGWRVGFLRKSKPNFQVPLPSGSWRPSKPTLIIADYASEQLDFVSALALFLAELSVDTKHVVRLLLLERQVDDTFWSRFLGSSTGEGSRLQATRHAVQKRIMEPLTVTELSMGAIWQLVRYCPWRKDGLQLTVSPEEFFDRLRQIDYQRRALSAMILADNMADSIVDAPLKDLGEVLTKLIMRDRFFHWPPKLGAKEQPIGSIVADVFIACSSMIGRLTEPVIISIAKTLGQKKPRIAFVMDCARAVGSEPHKAPLCLDGIQPDLIGEYFALEALAGEEEEFPSALLLELLWRANGPAMAGFVLRASQNFPEHPSLDSITTPVSGLTESWWLHVLHKAKGNLSAEDIISTAIATLLEPAKADFGAAAALARFGWSATSGDFGQLSWYTSDRLCLAIQGLPVPVHTSDYREGLANCCFNLLTVATVDGELVRRDELLDIIRSLSTSFPREAPLRVRLASALYNMLLNTKLDKASEKYDALLNELRVLEKNNPGDRTTRDIFAKALHNVIHDSKEKGSLLAELGDLSRNHDDDDAVRLSLVKALLSKLINTKVDLRDPLLEELIKHSDRTKEIRAVVATAIYNTLFDATEDTVSLTQCDELLNRLRHLKKAHPSDSNVRKKLAFGLALCINHAQRTQLEDRGFRLGREFLSLVVGYPYDRGVADAYKYLQNSRTILP